MFIEEIAKNFGSHKVFCSFERTEFIQFSNLTFHCNRSSVFIKHSFELQGRLRFQLLLSPKTFSTQYKTPENDFYSISSTQWTLVSSNCTVEIYGTKKVYDQIDTPHADMCSGNNTLTHSVN